MIRPMNYLHFRTSIKGRNVVTREKTQATTMYFPNAQPYHGYQGGRSQPQIIVTGTGARCVNSLENGLEVELPDRLLISRFDSHLHR